MDPTTHTEDNVTEPLLQNEAEDASAADEELGTSTSPRPRIPVGTTHWLLTTCILLGDMFGLGTLTLPADFVRLGWIPALALVILFAIGDIYSGLLYTRLLVALPDVVVFDQIGERAMGKLGKGLVYGSIYLTILAEPVIFHLTCVEALKQMFYVQGLTTAAASGIVTAMVLPLAQMQHMHDLGWVALAGTVGMLVSVLVVVGKLLYSFFYPSTASDDAGAAVAAGAVRAAHTELFASSSYNVALVGVMDIVFTFGGQVNWMRYITTMKKRSQFVNAVSVTTAFMTVMYLVVGVVGYAIYGTSLDIHKPISSVIDQDVWSVVVNAGLFVHCIIAYQININVWCSSLLHVAAPKLADELSHADSCSKRMLWLAVTALCIVYSGAVSYSFPYFSIVMAIIASLGDLMSMFGLPCLFSLKLLKLSRAERGLCWVLVVLSVGLSAAGVVSSFQELITSWLGGGDGGDGNGLLSGVMARYSLA